MKMMHNIWIAMSAAGAGIETCYTPHCCHSTSKARNACFTMTRIFSRDAAKMQRKCPRCTHTQRRKCPISQGRT